MASSFTEFRGKGFWSRDWLLELWLRLLNAQIAQQPHKAPQWQIDLSERWATVIQLSGTAIMCPGLDEVLTDPRRIDSLSKLAEGAVRGLRTFGDQIPHGYLQALGFDNTEDLPLIYVEQVAERFEDLLRGRLTTDSSDSPTLPQIR